MPEDCSRHLLQRTVDCKKKEQVERYRPAFSGPSLSVFILMG